MGRFVIVLLAVLLLVSFVMNPTYDDLKYEVRQGVRGSVGVQDGGVVSVIADIAFEKYFDNFFSSYVRYRDYKFFSLVYLDVPGERPKAAIGAFGGWLWYNRS